MPNLGGWEWIILSGVFLLVMAIVIVLVVVLAVGRSKGTRAQQLASITHEQPLAVDSRLAEADRLLRSGQISQAEHQAMRSKILGIG